MRYGIECHTESNHKYDGQPYEIHLIMVFTYAANYSYLLDSVEDAKLALASAWTHDVIEDARQTYNDVKYICGEEVAEISYALTNEKGKNRKERANSKYYDEIRKTPMAVFVKICDRLANARYSKNQNIYTEKNKMISKKNFFH